jgi:hypothetical protein
VNTKDYEQAYTRALTEEESRAGSSREILGILRLLTQLASTAMLVLALWPCPPGFYSVLRWSVMITALLGLTDLQPRLWLLLPALLFNPLVHVPLGRPAWQILDVGTATLFLWLLGHDEARRQIVAAERDKRLHSARPFLMWYASSCGDTLDRMALPGSDKFHSAEVMHRIQMVNQATLEVLDTELRKEFDSTSSARGEVLDAIEEAEHGPLRSATLNGTTYRWRSRLPGIPAEVVRHAEGRREAPSSTSRASRP